MHKTGTKALQHLLYSKKRKLLRNGLFYPDIGSYHHNSILNLRHTNWSPEPILKQLDIARKKSASAVIFSAEVLSILSDNEIQQLNYHLGNNRIVFIFVFRHWCNYLQSRWAQNCKVRDSQTFEEYLKKLKRLDQKHIDVGYDDILKRFQKNSIAQIKAVSYSNSKKLQGSVLADVFKAMEFPDKLSKSLLRQEQYVNVRQNWIQIEQIRLLNAALSETLSLNKNDLFYSIGEFASGNVSYNLQLRNFNSKMLKSLSNIIEENKKIIYLSSSDGWINNLEKRFQDTCAGFFSNLHKNSIFFGDFSNEVKYTDLSLDDVHNINLRDVVQHFKINDF